MLQKEILKLSPRLITHILSWGQVKMRDKVWTKHDSKLYLFLELLQKQMYEERYLSKKDAYNKHELHKKII